MHKKNSCSPMPASKAAPTAVRQIEPARERQQRFNEMVRGERDVSRGQAVKTEWGNRVHVVPGELIQKTK